jgi:2-hydroxy-3-keto-5-methylthiopentenyl-1-phosphate phosphatase
MTLDPSRLAVFTDFDGTITDRDTLVFLCERLGGGGARVREVNERLRRDGSISLRQEIAANMRSIRAPFADAVRLLRAHVRIDPTFPAFVAWCAALGIPLAVLSAGFEEIVRLYLAADAFPGVEVRANTLHPDERKGWQCVFRDGTAFGHDKAAAVRAAQVAGRRVVFIGDGISDHGPAEAADDVFAKHQLAVWCRGRGIPCHEFRSFADVQAALGARLPRG